MNFLTDFTRDFGPIEWTLLAVALVLLVLCVLMAADLVAWRRMERRQRAEQETRDRKRQAHLERMDRQLFEKRQRHGAWAEQWVSICNDRRGETEGRAEG